MAAAQEWGIAHFDRLDALAVARSDDAADDALHSGKGDIDAHFLRLPLSDDERADPAVHRVMDSFDIAGPHSVAVLVTTTLYRDANPSLCAAVAAAIAEADDFITHNRGAAAEIYDSAVKSQDIPVEVLSDMLGDPDLGYQPASGRRDPPHRFPASDRAAHPQPGFVAAAVLSRRSTSSAAIELSGALPGPDSHRAATPAQRLLAAVMQSGKRRHGIAA